MAFQIASYFLNPFFYYGSDREVFEQIRVGLKHVITQLASNLEEAVRGICQVCDRFIFFSIFIVIFTIEKLRSLHKS